MQSFLIDNKSCKIYFLVNQTKVYFNADFDSGNVQKVQQLGPYQYKVHPGFDKVRNSTNKTFFHFKVYGLKMCKVSFIITRINIIQRLIKSNDKLSQNLPSYHPVSRRPNQQFQKISLDVKKYYNQEDEPELSFSFEFQNDQYVQFAFTYPYSYQECQNMIGKLKNKYQNHHSVYFQDQILCYSQQRRKVHLITITEKQNCLDERQQAIPYLFPQNVSRALKIPNTKPTIFLTARVHPGQTPASYCIQGILKFLLNQRDCRSFLLRKNFQFIIVPMINPDGVYHGMFRNDMNGENLNRLYLDCDYLKHPSIWSIKKLSQWLSLNKNVLFYFDFHAHPSTKNFFIYGNSFSQISLQTQAQLFGKLIEFNSPYFENFDSIYSQKQMKVKHKHDNYSKQGCARVFMHRTFNIVHSYTVQCGYHGVTKINQIQNKQTKKNYPTGNYIEDHQFQTPQSKQYTPQSYKQMGKSILITILDLLALNPYPKRIRNQIPSHAQLRKACGTKIYHQNQLFKMIDGNSYKKLSDMSTIIQEQYYNQKLKQTTLKLSTNPNNFALEDILRFINASPRSKMYINIFKNKRGLQGQKFKSLKKENETEQERDNYLQDKKQKRQRKRRIVYQTPQPASSKNEDSQDRSINHRKLQKSLTLKAENYKYQYDQVQRFNQIKAYPSYTLFPTNQKINSSQKYLSSSKSSIFNSLKEIQAKEKIQKKLNNVDNSFRKALKQKQFNPDVKQSKIQTALQKSITLRKGSLSKVVFIKKDELKLLRLSNLLSKKLQRQKIYGSSTKLKRQNNLLPSIKKANDK